MRPKLPAIQWYPGDWQKDLGVQSLDWQPRAIWWEVLQRMHQTEDRGKMVLNGRPMTDDEIARIINCDLAKFQQALEQIFNKGVASRDDNGALMNRRMVSDERLRNVRARAGAIGGHKKYSNSQAKSLANSTPSSSSSSSSSSSVSKQLTTNIYSSNWFSDIWAKYPRKAGKDKAQTYFAKSVKNEDDFKAISQALNNYLSSNRVRDGFVQDGSRWFRSWKDWIDYTEVNNGDEGNAAAYIPGKYDHLSKVPERKS